MAPGSQTIFVKKTFNNAWNGLPEKSTAIGGAITAYKYIITYDSNQFRYVYWLYDLIALAISRFTCFSLIA